MLTKDNRWKKGKSYRKYCYTVKDIANFSGKAIQTIRNDVCKGMLDLKDVLSVAKYIEKDITRDIEIKEMIKKEREDIIKKFKLKKIYASKA